MAGVAGLEPAHARIKTLCLTDLATPQSLKFIFLSMTRLWGCHSTKADSISPCLRPGTRVEFVANQRLKSVQSVTGGVRCHEKRALLCCS